MSLSLLLAILILVGLYFWLRRRRLPYSRRTSPRGKFSPAISDHRVTGGTRRELLRLVGGNRAVAERLVEQVKLRYPSRSEQWCWEKAIYDIQRDRRS